MRVTVSRYNKETWIGEGMPSPICDLMTFRISGVFMHKQLAVEALKFQARSPLFDSINEIMKDVLGRTSPTMDKRSLYSVWKGRKVAQRIIAVAKRYMGPLLERVYLEDHSYPNMYMMIQQHRQVPWKSLKGESTLEMILSRYEKNYDLKKGKFSLSDDTIPVTFCVGIATGCFTSKGNNNGRLMTSEELTALLIHELGHINDYIQGSSRVIKTTADAVGLVDYISSGITSQEALNVIGVLKKSTYLSPEWRNLLQKVEEYFRGNPNDIDPYFVEALSTLSTIVTHDSRVVSFQVLLPMDIMRSDKFSTKQVTVDVERNSDEFASRNGAGPYLVSALMKMKELDDGQPSVSLKKRIDILGLTDGIASLIAEIDDYNGIADGVYDPIIRRLELILETAKFSFSDTSLSQDEKSKIKEDITHIEKVIRDYVLRRSKRERNKFNEWMGFLLKGYRFTIAPLSSRLVKSYENMQAATRAVSRNSLYYLAEKSK